MNLAHVLDTEILSRVEKPSRYLGNEVNSVRKDPATVDVRLAFVFPDLYDLGLGNLGLHILYAVVNALPWAAAERGYAPAVDMEKELRARGLPLFALESKDSLGDFDGIGITLQTELTWTNILNILDLSGLPLRTKDRDDSHPLVFAGGPAVFNPEPLAPFVDFFVIGDGEDVVLDVCDTMRRLKGAPRAAKLLALSLLEGVYVPALYPMDTLPDGSIRPKLGAKKIRKRITRDLNGSTFPVDYLVPYTQQVHDRVSLEVLRGCTQGCRFCQAGMTTRPVRERTIDNIDALMRRTLEATGYEEVSLVSLSTCDYSSVKQMVNRAVEVATEQRISVSLPSLRLDSFSVELADMVAETRKSGITFAPEAASPRLRAVINKWIPDDELLNMSAGAYGLGWDLVKLYFMIGLPTERDDDIEAIADLAGRALEKGKGINPNARINLGVSTFVPKPFTPFQWAAQIPMYETERRQGVLLDKLRHHRGIKFGRHEPAETFLEGLLSRSDRRAGDLIEAAWRNGARFDAWGEHLNFDAWRDAIHATNFDVPGAFRERSVDERLPWDHIDVLISKEWFAADWKRAQELQHAEDCRHRKCHKCGVIDHERDLCASMLRDNVKARKGEAAFTKPERPSREEPPAAQRLWFKYGRTGSARFLSHLEAMNAWMRTLRRARVPMSYTQGFHPHAKVAFSSALPSGEETLGDWMDVVLAERVDPVAIMERLRSTLPAGFSLLSVHDVRLDAPSLMSIVRGAEYSVLLPDHDVADVAARVAAIAEATELTVDRRQKAKGRSKERKSYALDVRPMIQSIGLRSEGGVPVVDLVLHDSEGKPGKPREILPFLTDAPEKARVLKRETILAADAATIEAAAK